MGLDLSAYDSVLKDDYGPALKSLLNNKVKMWDLFHKNGDRSLSADGRNVIYPVHYGRNSGVGAVGESKTLPTAGNQVTAKVTVPYRYNYGRVQLTKQTIEASKTNKGAFKKAMEMEMNNLLNDLKRSLNRQLWGNGVGILCRVNGQQTTGTSLNVKDAHGVATTGNPGPARLIQVNDYVAFVRNATPTSASDTDIVSSSNICQVTAISADLKTLTLGTATGATLNDNDMVIMSPANTSGETSVNREVMGLLGIVDDGTYLGTLHGVVRSTVGQYKSTVLSLNGNLSLDVLQRADDLADEKGGSISKIISHHSVRREYLKLLMTVKRFTGEQTMKPDAGFEGAAISKDIEWNGRPWTVERMAPYGMIFGIDTSQNVRYVNCEGEWADDDGTILMRTVNKDIYEGRYRIFDNNHNDRPDTCWRIDGVNATIDVAAAE